MALYSLDTYSRSNVAAMLAAMPMEERRWTLNYLINIMMVPDKEEVLDCGTPSELTRRMLEKHCGAWVGEESSDEIMATIRSNSSVRKSIVF